MPILSSSAWVLALTDWKKTGAVVDSWIEQSSSPPDFLMTYGQWTGRYWGSLRFGTSTADP